MQSLICRRWHRALHCAAVMLPARPPRLCTVFIRQTEHSQSPVPCCRLICSAERGANSRGVPTAFTSALSDLLGDTQQGASLQAGVRMRQAQPRCESDVHTLRLFGGLPLLTCRGFLAAIAGIGRGGCGHEAPLRRHRHVTELRVGSVVVRPLWPAQPARCKRLCYLRGVTAAARRCGIRQA